MATPGSEGNAGGPSSVIAANIATAVGPIFIANLLNWMLMGTLIMQVYTYYRRFAKDRTWIRILVAVLFSLDIAHTCLLTAHGWFFTIEIWGQPDRLDEIPWSAEMIPFMSGLVSCIVQLFYAWRIWVLSKNKFLRVLAVLIVMLALMQGLSAMIGAIILLIDSSQPNLLRLHPAFSVWLAGSFTTDILITGCMTHILYNARVETKFTGSETMLTRMINNTMQTGAVTVVCALIDLVLFTKYIKTTYHHVPAYVLGKLYSNSLMLNLNLRKPQKPSSSSSSFSVSTGTDSLPMHYFRSRDTSTTQDSRRTAVSRGTQRKIQTSESITEREDLSQVEQENDPVKWTEPNLPTSVNIQIHTSTDRGHASVI